MPVSVSETVAVNVFGTAIVPLDASGVTAVLVDLGALRVVASATLEDERAPVCSSVTWYLYRVLADNPVVSEYDAMSVAVVELISVVGVQLAPEHLRIFVTWLELASVEEDVQAKLICVADIAVAVKPDNVPAALLCAY